jgi:pyruvate decarboxylase
VSETTDFARGQLLTLILTSQVSVQELSPMIRKGLTPIVFVINNSGYTIERCIHGEHRSVFASCLVFAFLQLHRHYNDVANWNWTALLDALHDDGKHKTVSYSVRTKDELEKLLVDMTFAKAEKMQLVEVVMEKLDAPRALLGQAKK